MTSSPATESALRDHNWFQFRNLTCCKKCGIVQGRDGSNKPCKGIVNVELRQDEKDAFSDAWDAMQHSEDMALKSIHRKLSIHELRSFLMLVTLMILQGRPPVSSPVGESGSMNDGLPAGAGPLPSTAVALTSSDDAPQGHDAPCYYCGEPCDAYAGNPSKWPIPLCHTDDPGVAKWHHTGCVSARLIENQPTSAWRDIASAPKDGSDILLWAPDYNDTPIIGRWSEGADAWDSEVATMNEGPSTGGDPEECDGPTHWMPLPLPPGEEK